jgi:hypothetical protein
MPFLYRRPASILEIICFERLSHAGDETSYPKGSNMLDLMMLAIGLGFFVLTLGYLYACDRL